MVEFDALVKSPKSPFDKLRENGGLVAIIDFTPFEVSLSNHRKDFLRDNKIQAHARATLKSFNLHKQPKHLLECAKRAVEIAIEQDENAAIKWLQVQTKEAMHGEA